MENLLLNLNSYILYIRRGQIPQYIRRMSLISLIEFVPCDIDNIHRGQIPQYMVIQLIEFVLGV